MATKPRVTTRDMGSPSLQKAGSKSKKPAVADSWEDEYDSASEREGESSSTPKDIPTSTSSGFQAPPPTPASPSYLSGSSSPWQPMTAAAGDPSYLNADATRRPEKTDAVARRMIASALGVKAPRRTEEERAYDRAVREKERKRKEDERAEEKRKEEEAEKAKAAIWND